MQAPTPSNRYRFGLFEADPASGELLRQGVRIRVQDQPFRLLTILLERSDEVVSRQELREKLWPADTYVQFDGSLKAALRRLRAALGDSAENPIFIETVPKRGYRFIAPVTCVEDSKTSEVAETPASVLSSGSQAMPERHSMLQRRWPLWWAVPALLAICSLAGWRYTRSRPAASTNPRVIAVLPFTNEGAGPDLDYLRYAIANDLVTDLTHAHWVSVRPFASTSRYTSQPIDLAAMGKELRVTHVLAGGFLLDKQHLRVNLELVDVALNQPIWRDEVIASPQDLVSLHDRLEARAAEGLLPALNISNAQADEIPAPKNEQALDLFLHSLTIPLDPEANQFAVKKLQESVSLDSGYAPAWGELGWRYYVDSHYGSGREAAIAKSLQAYERQSEADPSAAPSVPTMIRAERGDLNGAYDQAVGFVRRRPDLSTAHFGLSYVFRYAGLLDEAGKECDAAFALDPGFNGLRTCANPFIQEGDYAHAARYISLDARFAYSRLMVQLRTGNTAPILAELTEAAQSGFHEADIQLALFRACLNHAPQAELSKAATELEDDPVLERDAEPSYMDAEFLAFCGQGDAALRQLQKAIKGNYCSYPAMDKDPLFDSIRQRSEFAELRQAAIQCQQNFLDHREQARATLRASRP